MPAVSRSSGFGLISRETPDRLIGDFASAFKRFENAGRVT